MNLNVVLVAGRLTDDPTVTFTQTGKAKATFSVAVNEGFGERRTTEFIDCEAWEKQAEKCDVARKGTIAIVQGRWNKQSWTSREGQKRSKVLVKASQVQFLTDQPSEPRQRPPQQEEAFPDDIPF